MAKNQQSQKAEITSLKVLRTPKGVAAFAYLRKTDESFGKVRHRITVFFPDYKTDPEFKNFLAAASELNKKYMTEQGKKPGKVPAFIKVTDEKLAEKTGQKVGTPHIEFASTPRENDESGIPVFSAAGIEDNSLTVYGGDIVRVETNIAGWIQPTGCGIKGYLKAVQLLKSNWQGGSGSTFEAEAEYLNDDSESPAVNSSVADALDDEGDDNGSEEESTEEESTEESNEEEEDSDLGGLL